MFGFLKGWWEAIESGAPDQLSPCLSRDAWAESLSHNGFTGVDVWIPGFNNKECHESSIIVFTASDPPSEAPPLPTTAIIVDKNSVTQMKAAEKLADLIKSRYGISCGIIVCDNKPRKVMFLQSFELSCLMSAVHR